MNKTVLYALSFSTNAAILVFEIAGGRLLAPYLGTAVGVWAGLISVVLAGMALGYHWGGKVADTHASKAVVGRFLFASGLAALIAWSVRDIVPSFFALTGFSETWGALLVGTVLFMPTVFILAAISPLLVKNLIKNIEHSASEVGTLYAVGSIGSIVGAVGTGMLLIPHFGVSAILLGVAVFLLCASFLLLKDNVVLHTVIVIVVIALAFFLNALPTRASIAEADITTEYNRVFVDRLEKFGNARSLSMDPFGTQCAMFVDADNTADERHIVFRYIQGFDILRETARPEGAPRALFLGGCNFSYPRYLLNLFPETTADVVEIDRGMTKIAETYFGFDTSKFPTLTIFYEDARTYLKKPRGKYDIVFMDAFGASRGIPVHLTTKEMFQSIGENLKSDGTLFINAHGAYEGEGARFPAALLRTVREVFPYVSVYRLGDEPARNQNLLFAASFEKEFPDILTDERFPEITLTETSLPESDIILTDDFAPVERLLN